MRRFIRWTLAGLFTLLVLPVVQEYAVAFAHNHHLYDSTGQGETALGRYVQMIAAIPYFEYVLAFVAGLTLGVWLDARLRRFNRKKADRLPLGQRAIILAKHIRDELERPDINSRPLQQLFAEIRSILIEMYKNGLDVPMDSDDEPKKRLERLDSYLSNVGPLLRDGYVKQARRAAKETLARSKPIEPSERPLPQASEAAREQ